MALQDTRRRCFAEFWRRGDRLIEEFPYSPRKSNEFLCLLLKFIWFAVARVIDEITSRWRRMISIEMEKKIRIKSCEQSW
jgi:hypothetical protein